MTRINIIRLLSACAAGLLFLTGCAQPVPEIPEGKVPLADTFPDAVSEMTPADPVSGEEFFSRYEQPGAGYQAPAALYAEFHADKANGKNGAYLDLSMVNQGVVAAKGSSSKRLRFVIVVNDQNYYYNMKSDGTPSVFPLTMGSATYKFRIMENTTGSKYRELYSNSTWVQLENQFVPYVRNSDYVPYSSASACVKKAAELAQTADSAVGVVSKVYEYITNGVTYDYNKANTVQSGYMSDPDSTMNTGKGICFDYAALAAAMLRSQGIPVKMVFGYVGPSGAYHAWNMFYTAETGWVTVSFQVPKDAWNRLDLTFCAGGIDPSYIGNGTNYSDVYYY